MFFFIGKEKINELECLLKKMLDEIVVCRDGIASLKEQIEIYKNEQTLSNNVFSNNLKDVVDNQVNLYKRIDLLENNFLQFAENNQENINEFRKENTVNIYNMKNQLLETKELVESVGSNVNNLVEFNNVLTRSLQEIDVALVTKLDDLNKSVDAKQDALLGCCKSINDIGKGIRNILHNGIKDNESNNTIIKSSLLKTENSVDKIKCDLERFKDVNDGVVAKVSDVENVLVKKLTDIDMRIGDLGKLQKDTLECNSNLSEEYAEKIIHMRNDVMEQLMQVDESIRLLLINSIMDDLKVNKGGKKIKIYGHDNFSK